jgi:UDP-2,4-diacetamido-2,4,6-trideoxy-beta-L-altropyranose hydrolase
MSVLFRVDSNLEIGLGHLQRCLSLAMALQHFDTTCFFLTNKQPVVTDRVKRFGFKGWTLDTVDSWSTDDVAQTSKIAELENCDAIVVDSDYEGTNYLSQLRSAGLLVCAIEDLSPHSFPCQLVVNGDVHAHQLRYESSSGDTLFLLGPEYSLLRPEFWKVESRIVNKTAKNILVTLGGADPYNLTPRVLKLLDEIPGTFSVTALIGPFFTNVMDIQASAERADGRIKLVHSPDSVCNLMLESDLAVSAGGQTLYELACTGCPTIAVRIAPNQDRQLQVFEESGFIRIAGHGEDDSIIDAIGDAVFSLLQDCQARSSMSAAGQRLIDGQGALRVARTIVETRNVKKAEAKT